MTKVVFVTNYALSIPFNPPDIDPYNPSNSKHPSKNHGRVSNMASLVDSSDE